MDDKAIRRWYHENGVPYFEEDWGPRLDTGESAEAPPFRQERRGVRTSESTPDRMWWWEKQLYPWRQRSPSEAEWQALLDDFFAPYLALLPRAKGNLLRQVYGDTATYEEVAEEGGVSRQGAHQATQRALRQLTRIIAEDDPDFSGPLRRNRDYEDEARAAQRVFAHYLERRQT